jgi:hypothetical protein
MDSRGVFGDCGYLSQHQRGDIGIATGVEIRHGNNTERDAISVLAYPS